jgi:hypothetical protein
MKIGSCMYAIGSGCCSRLQLNRSGKPIARRRDKRYTDFVIILNRFSLCTDFQQVNLNKDYVEKLEGLQRVSSEKDACPFF